MRSYVNTLANRIALFPAAGVAAAKQSINSFARPSLQALQADGRHFISLSSQPATMALVEKFLDLTNNETATPSELKLSLADLTSARRQDELFTFLRGQVSS